MLEAPRCRDLHIIHLPTGHIIYEPERKEMSKKKKTTLCKSKMLNVVFVGDVMLGRTFNKQFDRLPRYHPFGNTTHIIEKADLSLGNLEFTITPHRVENQWPNKTFHYQLDPRHAHKLLESKLQYVSLANNHILDYGVEGLEDTISHLRQLGIKFSGAGNTLAEAQKPAVMQRHGKTIAVFSMADHYDYWTASKTTPGIWYISPESLDDAIAVLARYRRQHPRTLIIVSIHWGPNYEKNLSAWKRTLARRLIVDARVDVIHGHSAHHVQPPELVDSKLVLHSTGDFVDDYAIDAVFRNDLGMITELHLDTFTGNTRRVTVYPTKISNLKVNLLSDGVQIYP